MIIFLHGADTYRSRQKLFALKQKFINQQNKNELSISVVDAANLNIDELRKTMLSSSLFSEKRLIIIEKLLTGINKKDQEQTKALIQEAINILKKTNKNNILIFWEEKIQEKELNTEQKKLYQLLKKQKYAQGFKPLPLHQLNIWIKKQVEKNAMKIEDKAVDFLIDIHGNNLYVIKNELDKLIAAQPSTNSIISLENLKNIILSKPEQSIWQLIDAIGQKNKKNALKFLSDQIKTGTNIDYLISMLAYQYRIIFRIKSYVQDNKIFSPYQLAKKLYLHPFVCKKGLQQEKNYTMEELKKIYRRLLDIDLLRKTRPINAEILLDLLILKN